MFGPKHSIKINLHYLLLFEFLGKEFFFFFLHQYNTEICLCKVWMHSTAVFD